MKIIYHHRTQRKLVEGVHIKGVLQSLKNQGHSVDEIALIKSDERKHSGPIANDVKNKLNIKALLGVIAKRLPNKIFRTLEILYNIPSFLMLQKSLLKEKPDFIYERYAYFNFAGILIGKFYKVPVILEVNIMTSMNDTRKLELSALANLFENFIIKRADAVIVVSKYLKEQIISKRIRKHNIFVQPNAFSHEVKPSYGAFERSEIAPQKKQGKIIIGFIGGLGKWYNLPSLLKSFNNLQHKHKNIHLVFIGDGTEREKLEKLAREYKIEDNVTFCGRVMQEDVFGFLRHMDIGVIPSTNLWGSPMKLFEYMGMGVAVVAPNIDVVTSIMQNDIHGKTFQYQNELSFEHALDTLLENPDSMVIMGRNAREHILKNHTWEIVANNIIKIAADISN